MNMSPLTVVQPLLDAGKNTVSSGKTQGNDSFQTLLKDQMSANQAEKQNSSQPKTQQASQSVDSQETQKQDAAKQSSSTKEPKDAKAEAQLEDQVANKVADVAVLTEMMAVVAGAQIVPVETTSGADTVDLVAETGIALQIADADGVVSDKTLKNARDVKTLASQSGLAKGDLVDENLSSTSKTDVDAELKVNPDAKAEVAVQTMEEAPLSTTSQTSTAINAVTVDKATADTALQTQQVTTQQVQQTVATISTQQQAQVVTSNIAEASQVANQIVQRMGTPEWNQAVSQRVMWMIGQEQQSASLTLNPPELGPVRIVVNVSNNNATANFFSANPDVRQALEGSLPRLREMMEGAGIQLGQAQVGAENSGNQQQEQFASSGNRTQNMMNGHTEVGGVAGSVAGDAQTVKQVVSKGLVDTFV